MADNYVQDGETLTLTAPYARSAGQGALVGAIFGVALNDVDNGADGEFSTEGVWTLAKTSAQAWSVGDQIYWDNSNKRCDADAAVGRLIGVCTAAADNPSSTGSVKLNESISALAEGAQAAVASIATADADGTYGAAEASLINELKTQVNDLLAKLRILGIIAT